MNSEKYQKKIDALVSYFKSGESKLFKIGLEIEHFIVDKDSFSAVPYQGNTGIEGILKRLQDKGWQGVYEDDKLLGLSGKDANISLEPGGQFELSLHPLQSIKEVEDVYLNFLQQITPILEVAEKVLLTTGYQPISKIEDIELLPKKRYYYMYDYFKDKGKHAHNMMKGTSSIQVNLDYDSEEDFRKKMRVAYFLSPLIYYFFDNGPFYEGEISGNNNFRSIIWDNCDSDRCGIIESVFNENFSYKDYAEYILNIPAIITMKDGELIYTEKKLIKDIYEPGKFTNKELDHLLTMAFPDVRLKKYVEIRMGDSLPYPYSIAYAAFWQGLLYNQTALAKLFDLSQGYRFNDIMHIKNSIRRNGLKSTAYGEPVHDFLLDLLDMAATGLREEDKLYIDLLKTLFLQYEIPKNKTLLEYNKTGKKVESLNWCKVQGGISDVTRNARSI